MPHSDIASLPTVDGLDVSLDKGILSVTLNRPDSLNSLILPVVTALADAMETAAIDPEVKVVRLGGVGRGFCSGAGIGPERSTTSTNGALPDSIILEINRLMRAITGLPHPVVSVVHGPAAGVGVSLALACDIVLASEQAFFMLAFTKIGLMTDGGASALVAANIGRARAMRMALLGERLTAAEVASWGLVSAIYPADEFDAAAEKVVAQLAAGPSVALARTKAALNAATLTELEPTLWREFDGQSQLLVAHDFVEGVTAFQQKREATFTDR